MPREPASLWAVAAASCCRDGVSGSVAARSNRARRSRTWGWLRCQRAAIMVCVLDCAESGMVLSTREIVNSSELVETFLIGSAL